MSDALENLTRAMVHPQQTGSSVDGDRIKKVETDMVDLKSEVVDM